MAVGVLKEILVGAIGLSIPIVINLVIVLRRRAYQIKVQRQLISFQEPSNIKTLCEKLMTEENLDGLSIFASQVFGPFAFKRFVIERIAIKSSSVLENSTIIRFQC